MITQIQPGIQPDALLLRAGLWSTINLRAFLGADQQYSILQAAFRLAYELPCVARVAVGTSDPAHLRDLAAATELTVRVARLSLRSDLG